MTRREALSAAPWIAAAAWLLPGALLQSCEEAQEASAALGPEAMALLDEIAETIFPSSPGSPGAKAAQAAAGVALLLECYPPEEGQRLRQGLAEFEAQCRRERGQAFIRLSTEEKEAFFLSVHAAAEREERHYLRLLRELVENSYFSSEIGMTQARRWLAVPGRWEGCTAYLPGQPAWA
jgi:hypothetical protein